MKVRWLIEYSIATLAIIYLRTELMIVIVLYKTLKIMELYRLFPLRKIEYCLSRTTVIFIKNAMPSNVSFKK
jgi:hypothetical protein